MIFSKDYLIQQSLSVLKDIAQSKGIYNLLDAQEKVVASILKFQHQYGDTLRVQVTNLQPGDFVLYFIRKEGVIWADNENDIHWQGWAKATHVSTEPLNPHFAPSTVTIGFYGILAIKLVTFYTEKWKIGLAIASPIFPNCQTS
jgi:hypothetical protein